ncbi:FG-GAP repeat domain-containing protein, partial [Chroococcidiopsis cubana]|uniref:FG-GAP repeat domain-containing protein n=1 Tax=Chroococcidiopsis cubana TaxID=171392 RepID=UPI0018F6027C
GYGDTNYTAVPADYDGDAKADLSVRGNNGAWYIDYSGNGYGRWDASYNGYGDTNYTAVPSDYDGDKKADLSVWGKNGTWYIDYSGNGYGSWDATY